MKTLSELLSEENERLTVLAYDEELDRTLALVAAFITTGHYVDEGLDAAVKAARTTLQLTRERIAEEDGN